MLRGLGANGRFAAERLTSLVRTLELTNIDEHYALQKVASFGTLIATYEKGFLLILEPYETEHATVPNPIFHTVYVFNYSLHKVRLICRCLDPSLAIAPVFERFSSVVITSGTISPLDMYAKILQFQPVLVHSYPMTLQRNAFFPMVITRGSDQVPISSRFEVRNDPAVVRNFGSILIDMAKTVPDGVVAFFPSYLYMESIVSAWYDMVSWLLQVKVTELMDRVS
jgi:DNA excision repair protein ERCC-2